MRFPLGFSEKNGVTTNQSLNGLETWESFFVARNSEKMVDKSQDVNHDHIISKMRGLNMMMLRYDEQTTTNLLKSTGTSRYYVVPSYRDLSLFLGKKNKGL